MKTFLSTLIAAAFFIGAPPGSSRDFSYSDLVDRITDLTWLAELPQEGERCEQFSSYDRKSRYDSNTSKYIGWDANGDGGGVLRQEGNQFVLAEMEGPGCIWRIWSATPKQGRVRVYLDGAAEPAIDLPFTSYFDGKHEPFTRPALVHEAAKGWNNYTPIPFQKSCKIVADHDWGLYHQFNFTKFPEGTRVPTFNRALSAKDHEALNKANELLTRCGPVARNFQSSIKGQSEGSGNGTFESVARLEGPAAIRGIRVRTELPPTPADLEALRSATIEIRWDGEKSPSVWAPLGDFFGTAPGANPYRSLPMGLTEDGWWYCNWYMPFSKSAEVTFRKEGNHPMKLQYEIGHGAISGKIANLARFHAKWHRDMFLPAEPERAIDWTILRTTGRGRFVGVMLHIWNPRGSWWGEGDEKFFVDGETFPSTIGTGSEDYFGYAWCDPGLFQNAFHNQTRNDGNNRGHISVNRWQIADNIPFQKSFDGFIEKYFPNSRPTLYAATAYWYQAPGGYDPYLPLPVEERVGYWTNTFEIPRVKGAIEGESLRVLSRTVAAPQQQDMTGFAGQWSNDSQLWWINSKPGEKLNLGFPVDKAARYKLICSFTKARDYGVHQLYLNGSKLGDKIDFYHTDVVTTGPMDLGSHDLPAGENKLTVEVIGANPQALPSYMFGLDYIKLEPVTP